MLAMMTEIFRAKYVANEAGNIRKSKFSILLFFSLSPPINTFIIILI